MKKLTKVNSYEYLTVKEAARKRGITEGTLRSYISRGLVEAYKFKTLTLVHRDDC